MHTHTLQSALLNVVRNRRQTRRNDQTYRFLKARSASMGPRRHLNDKQEQTPVEAHRTLLFLPMFPRLATWVYTERLTLAETTRTVLLRSVPINQRMNAYNRKPYRFWSSMASLWRDLRMEKKSVHKMIEDK